MARLIPMAPTPQLKACLCTLLGLMALCRIIILKCYCNVSYGVRSGPFNDAHQVDYPSIHRSGKISLVKRIITSLWRATRGGKTLRWQPLAVEDYLQEDQSLSVSLTRRHVCEIFVYLLRDEETHEIVQSVVWICRTIGSVSTSSTFSR